MDNPGVDLNQLHVFATVVREQSFTSAARVLGMPKSTVSKRVADLEARLGVRLLQRSTRRLRLTEAGTAYYERCARIVAEAEEADRLLTSLDASPRGLLRVAAPTLFGHAFLGPVVTEFLQKHPHVSLDLVLLDRRVDLIEEGFDLAIWTGPLHDSALVSRRLGATANRLVASPAWLARNAPPQEPSDLRNLDCVAFRSMPGEVVWALERGTKTVSVPIRARFAVTSHLLAREAALAGLGIANIPQFLVAEDLRLRRLAPVLGDWTSRRGEIQIVSPPGRYPSPRVRAFVDGLIARFAAAPPWTVGS